MGFGKEAASDSGRWSRKVVPTRQGSEPARRMVRGQQAILRVIGPLAILVMVATVVCTMLGFVLARQTDDHLTAEHRQALRGAIEALQAVSPEFPAVDPKLLLLLERASGLDGRTGNPAPERPQRPYHRMV